MRCSSSGAEHRVSPVALDRCTMLFGVLISIRSKAGTQKRKTAIQLWLVARTHGQSSTSSAKARSIVLSDDPSYPPHRFLHDLIAKWSHKLVSSAVIQ